MELPAGISEFVGFIERENVGPADLPVARPVIPARLRRTAACVCPPDSRTPTNFSDGVMSAAVALRC